MNKDISHKGIAIHNKSPYTISFSIGGLLHREILAVLPLFNREQTVELIREEIKQNNFLQINSEAADASAGTSGTSAASAAGPVVIPAAAVLRRGELTAVYAADGQGGFTLRQIRLGRTLPGDAAVEVLSGLTGDETLALDPVQAGIQARTAAAAR